MAASAIIFYKHFIRKSITAGSIGMLLPCLLQFFTMGILNMSRFSKALFSGIGRAK